MIGCEGRILTDVCKYEQCPLEETCFRTYIRGHKYYFRRLPIDLEKKKCQYYIKVNEELIDTIDKGVTNAETPRTYKKTRKISL